VNARAFLGWPEPRTGVRMEVTVQATATEIGALPEPQRDAFMRGLGLVMGAAEAVRMLGEQVRRDRGEQR